MTGWFVLMFTPNKGEMRKNRYNPTKRNSNPKIKIICVSFLNLIFSFLLLFFIGTNCVDFFHQVVKTKY